MNRSPPIPLTYGWTTPITACAAIAASMAFPPCSRMCAPACDARNCGAATIPNFVTTMERPWPGTEENSWPTNIEEIDRANADASVTTFMPFSFAQIGCDTGHLNRIVSIWKFHPTALRDRAFSDHWIFDQGVIADISVHRLAMAVSAIVELVWCYRFDGGGM